MSARGPEVDLSDLVQRVGEGATRHRERRPGEPGGRQPLHTLYVPADRFDERTTSEFGAEALRLLGRHAADGAAIALAFEVDARVAEPTRARVEAKLRREPVEDVRIDFEDGYGVRPDEDEDRDAERTAAAVLASRRDGSLPPFVGVRVKSFADGGEARSLRTLARFLGTLTDGAAALPEGFAVTFPKVVTSEHVAIFAEALGRLESGLGLGEGTLRMEVQVETPPSVLDDEGTVAAPRIVEAAGGRLAGMHFGVFDYTASLGLMPWEQRLDHPANDFARFAIQVALAGTGVRTSDGSTNVVPASDETREVRAAWRVHASHVRHSLESGFVQGWDLHPSHLVSRFATVYGWLLPHLDDAVTRVRAWRERSAAAEGVLDEPATVSSLLRYLRFVVSSGAAEQAEVLERSGLTRDELVPGRAG